MDRYSHWKRQSRQLLLLSLSLACRSHDGYNDLDLWCHYQARKSVLKTKREKERGSNSLHNINAKTGKCFIIPVTLLSYDTLFSIDKPSQGHHTSSDLSHLVHSRLQNLKCCTICDGGQKRCGSVVGMTMGASASPFQSRQKDASGNMTKSGQSEPRLVTEQIHPAETI